MTDTSSDWPEPHPKADEHNRLFTLLTGAVIREFSAVDWALVDCFAALLNTDHWRGRAVLSEIRSVSAKRKLIQNLSNAYLDDPLRSEILSSLQSVKTWANKRNSLAHHLGGIDADDPRYVLLFSDVSNDDDGVMFGSLEKIQLSSVKQWPRQIRELSVRLRQQSILIRQNVKSDPKMHRMNLKDVWQNGR